MRHFFVFFIALFACLWTQGQSRFSNIVQVVIITKEDLLEKNTLSVYVSQENITDRRSYNFTVLKGGKRSYQEILETFCSVIKHTGVTAIISTDGSSYFKLFDVYASYMGVPVIKLFHSNYEPPVAKQEQGTILHLDPNPSSRLVVIIEILKNYRRNDRVVVISDEKRLSFASKLLARLRESSSSIPEVFLNLTITENETNYHKILSILSALNTRAVVLLLEQNLTTDLMNAAENFGFSDNDCIWILENSLHENKRIPLLGKTLGIQFSRDHFNNKKLSTGKNVLMKDAIKILEKTFQSTLGSTDSTSVFSLLKDCDSTKRELLGRSFHRAMKNVQFQGNTGWVQFNSQGYRTNVEYDIVYWYKKENASATNNKMLLAEYHNNKLTVHYSGWPPAEQISSMLELKIAKNIPLKVSVLVNEPYVTINKNSAQNNSDETCSYIGWSCVGVDGTHTCCTGYCIDLLKILMRELGFSVIIHLVKDGKYGALNHTTGKWSGLIGEVVQGETDIALADLTINEQRSEVVDFTYPFMDAGMGVLVKVARRDKNDWTGFMDPFATTLWIALIICINAVVLIVWLLERYSPFGQLAREEVLHKNKKYSFDLIQAIWFTWGLLLTMDVGCKPKSFSCRIVTLVLAFSMLIVITNYTANLAAFLVVEEEILPLSDAGIRDHKLQNPPSGFRIGTLKDSSFEKFFQGTDDPTLSRIWQHMKHNSVKDFAEAIKQMNSGKLQAFVSDYRALNNFAAESPDCSFKIVGKSVFQSGFGLALGKNSSLTAKISEVLLNYGDYDISRRLINRWFLGKCNMIKEDKNALFARLSIADLSGLFLAICLGVVISVLFFTMECLKITYKNSSSYDLGKK